MKIAYFDCSFGAAGDMLVAACIDAGASLAVLEEQLGRLNLPDGSYKLVKSAVSRCSIRSTKFDVQLLAHVPTDSLNHEHSPGGDHKHRDDHDDHHMRGLDHSHEHKHHDHRNVEPERSLSDILALIEDSSLEPVVKKMASDIFNRLGLAESLVHGVAVEKIHFHEVGAIDAIVDIVGFAIAYNQLAIEAAYVSALPLGGGTVQTMHGLLPMPGPAVLNLLKEAGAPTRAFDVNYECLTPTGAAILTTICQGWGQHPAFLRINSVGYGAGTIDPAKHPNVVRLIVGDSYDLSHPSEVSTTTTSSSSSSSTSSFADTARESQSGSVYRSEVVAVLETNIDDCSPQVLAHAMECLIDAGALDVAIVPQIMKKGRPGHKLSVVSKSDDSLRLQDLILRETTSLGVRCYFCERIVLERNFQQITLGEGPSIRIKVGRDLNGKLVNFHPEYDDMVENARSTQRPLKEVLLQSLTLAANRVGEVVEND
ncbi:MAG: nickel pincer cofactor biosynthesis protein LarC [Candidatus Melainabacteria bacterium]|nr:nickel pincer cofactor biosynthesis protein LarC [Candidatus Melainabacteria bacterium]